MHFLTRKRYVMTLAGFTLVLSMLTNCWSLAGPTISLANTSAMTPETSSLPPKDLNENVSAPASEVVEARIKERVGQTLGKLPMSFEVNQGQADPNIKFISRGSGFGLFLLPQEMVLSVRNGGEPIQNHHSTSKRKTRTRAHTVSVKIKLQNANPTPDIVGLDPLPGKTNYFLGNDPSRWQTNVSSYRKVKYTNVYPGIDMVYHGDRGQFEYDFVVAKGADPGNIRLKTEGARKIRLDRNNDLIISVAGGEIRQHRPVVYQQVAGERREVAARYVLKSKREVVFELGAYDRAEPLVIDPVVSYSSYLGSTGSEQGENIALDPSGNIYVSGFTSSANFPLMTPFQGTHGGGSDFWDAFITKLDPTGSTLIYSTFIGGNGDEYCFGLAVDVNGNAHLSGMTRSTNFPRANAFQNSYGGGLEDAFVTKLDALGSTLVYSTYLGGSSSERVHDMTVDTAGNAYVTGYTHSSNFPTLTPFQPSIAGEPDAYVSKFDPLGTLLYSSFLGGSQAEIADGIAVDSSENVYLTGYTGSSTSFPLVNPSQSTFGGGVYDVFLTKINALGNQIVYSTFLGGSGTDVGRAVAVDSSGIAYVTGHTPSTNFPTLNAFQPTYRGGINDAFVSKFNASGNTLLASTYLGGFGSDEGWDITIHASGNVYVTGITTSTNFPTLIHTQGGNAGGQDGFVTKLENGLTTPLFSTYYGGNLNDYSLSITTNPEGDAFIAGRTLSTNLPLAGAYQTALAGSFDTFMAQLAGLDSYVIRGKVTNAVGAGMSAVTVTLSGSQTGTKQTDSAGNYSFAGLIGGGNLTVTPTKTPFTFTPVSRTFNNISADQTADFGTVAHGISGRVADGQNNALSGATITLTGSQAGTTQTDASGNYSFPSVAAGGNYTLTPSKPDHLIIYSFTPAIRSFTNLNGNQTGADFTYTTSTQMGLGSIADAYVQDGVSAGTNFGSVTPMLSKMSNQADQRRDGYFKFDLSILSRPIVSAKLRIHAALSAAGSVATTAYSVPDTSWGENTITWTNKPARVTTLGTATVISTTYSTFDLDVSSYVIAEKSAGRNVVSLALHNSANSTPHILLNSREAPANKPQLIVTTTNSPNAPPSVSLTGPGGGASFTAPTDITLDASASDSDGVISKVDFYAGGWLINTDNTAPYSIQWSNVPTGSYSLTAVATDSAGATTTSSPVAVSVTPANNSPAVSLTSPAGGIAFPAGSNISLSATATDGDGTITKVDFYAGASLIGTDTTEPYNLVWSNAPAGAHALTAVATDNVNGTAPSPVVNINVIWETGLSPIADAYVRDGASASTNFGTQPELQTQVSSTGNNRETYLKFDINTVTNIVSAKLRLYGRLSDTSGNNVPASVYAVSDILWPESGSNSITWNTKPTAGNVQSSVTITDNNPRWYEWDVTTYVQAEKNATRNTITLAVKNTASSAPYAIFSSREASSTQPQLVITTTATRNILFVTGSATLNTAEIALKTRMENLGFTVTAKAAGSTQNTAVKTTDADGKAAVVISSTVTPANVLMKFRHVPIPVLLWEFDLLDDQGMTESTAGLFGTQTNQGSVLILEPAHPMAAGFSSTINVVNPNSTFTWGKPNANAVKIASLTGDATRIAIFGYDTGALMPALLPDGLPAPARRVAFFLTDTNGNTLTIPPNGGTALFDAAIKWLTALSVAPTLSNLIPTSGTIGTSVTLSGYNFGDTQGTSSVKFNGTTAAASSWNGTTITVSVPAGATTGPVTVTVAAKVSNAISFTVNLPPVDSDGDGLADAWEIQYFGNLGQGANGDPDGDGLTNLQEYQQGRNPTKNAVADDGTGVNMKVHTPLASPSP